MQQFITGHTSLDVELKPITEQPAVTYMNPPKHNVNCQHQARITEYRLTANQQTSVCVIAAELLLLHANRCVAGACLA